jgi:hypothetical protein
VDLEEEIVAGVEVPVVAVAHPEEVEEEEELREVVEEVELKEEPGLLS